MRSYTREPSQLPKTTWPNDKDCLNMCLRIYADTEMSESQSSVFGASTISVWKLTSTKANSSNCQRANPTSVHNVVRSYGRVRGPELRQSKAHARPLNTYHNNALLHLPLFCQKSDVKCRPPRLNASYCGVGMGVGDGK